MASTVGVVKSFENGTFYVRDTKGDVHQLKAGEMISEGDHVYGAYGNTPDAKMVIDVLLAGAGDLVLAGDGALQFEGALLATMFSHNDAVIHINSLMEGLAITAAAEVQMQSAAEEKTAGTEAGNETAAGDAVTDTERLADTFAARDGAITDVTTDLRATASNVGETTAPSMEATLLATTEQATPPSPPPPPPPPSVEASAPTLDVALGEVHIEANPTQIESPSVNFSAIGAGIAYTDGTGHLILDQNGNVASNGGIVHDNNGNGYGVTTTDEQSAGVQRIDTSGDAREALVLDMDENLISLDVALKHFKQDPEGVQWEAYDSTGKLVGEGTAYTENYDPGSDALHTVEITPNLVDNGSFQYVVFLGSEDGYYVKEVGSGTAVDYTYSYPLDIIDATLTDPTETLGAVIVTGLPVGATLTHDVYDDMTVPESGTVTFGSDTDYTSWTLTMDKELPEDSSIIASLTSSESDSSSATAYVGVYGDNVITGSEGADSLEGREGNDTLAGGAGSDSLYGESGDDTLTYDSHDVTIDGGTGTDTLILTGTTNIDLHTLASNSSNIEVIDLSSGEHDLTSITFTDVMNMTESGNSNLYILGDGADQVGFLNSGDWNQTGTAVSYDIKGTTYTFDEYTSADDPTVMVRVEAEIPVI